MGAILASTAVEKRLQRRTTKSSPGRPRRFPISMKKCCPGLTLVSKEDYSYCVPDKPDTKCSKDNPRGCFSLPYERNGQIVSYLKPGQKTEECPTGLMFPSSWNEGYGQGGDGRFQFQMIDKLEVPEDLPKGNYQLSWRWDCEQTPQVWNSCADIIVE